VTIGRPSLTSSRIESAHVRFQQLDKELDRLDTRDFEPGVRMKYMQLRGSISYYINPSLSFDRSAAERILTPLKAVLDQYRGPGSEGVTRRFPFLSDPELRSIVERDYAELVVKIYPAGAWKSTVILAGSILEAILFDRLADPNWSAAALASDKAPRDRRTGNVLPLEDWKLQGLIDVEMDIGVVKKGTADTIHQVLRDYRNFVHPKKEIRAAHACTEAEAMLSVGALDSVCNYVEANP
jgi:hypothetical protein